MRKLLIAIMSLMVAVLCWNLSQFITNNLVLGLFVNYGDSSRGSRVGFATMGGVIQFSIWVLMLWGIRKVVVSKMKGKANRSND